MDRDSPSSVRDFVVRVPVPRAVGVAATSPPTERYGEAAVPDKSARRIQSPNDVLDYRDEPLALV